MKKNIRPFVAGCLVTLLLTGLVGTAMATVGSRTVTVDYNNIKVTLDGQAVNLVDANGNTVEPFSIAGTTYLPIRAVASALGLNVSWDSATSTAVLTTDSYQAPENSRPSSGTPTISQQNALRKAEDYLSIMAFSRSGLIDQLQFEGFPEEDAVYAVDNCGADWNEQAAKKARDYLDIMGFSRDGLISQLVFDGFTQEQAEYGVTQVGY